MCYQSDWPALLRFSDVTAELARKEGEGDLVLNIGVMNTVVFSRQKEAIPRNGRYL